MELTKIFSPTKRTELEKILLNPRARHNQRQYLVGFLKYAGYYESEVCDIIRHMAKWEDYEEFYTHYQVQHIFMAHPKGESSQFPRTRGNTLNDILITFLKETKSFSLTVPLNLSDAVAYYSFMGFTVLPKAKGEKKPAVAWKDYTTKKPSNNDLMSWDFSGGICLLANDDYSFLDVDSSGYEMFFKGWHVERTPRGGIHVFGKGKINSSNVEGGELKGIGSLIIAAPTTGYVVL